ncbi:MAG: argininosuccinate lyase, partial [Actinobacteria bacterium]|nr:argininosuccinate lyase [Actinomycetota bacterium]
DLQEDKEVVFNSIENLLTLLPALTGMVASTNFDRKRMAKSAPEGFSLATEIADYLVRKGIPFSKAHEAAGKCVKLAEKSGVQLHELSATQLKSAHEQLDEGVRKFLDVKGAIASRDSVNGTAPKSVARQIRALGDSLKRDAKWISNESKRFSGMMSQ